LNKLQGSALTGKPKRQQVPKSARPMTFRGLLWCSECDRRFLAQFSNDTVRYICGSRETTEPCDHALHSIREETLLPWVDDLIAGFELGRMGGMRFGKKPLIAKDTAASAIQNLDAPIKRLDTRFAAGTISDAEFKAELETLRRQRNTYEAQLSMTPNRLSLKVSQRSGSQLTLRCVTNFSAPCSRSFTSRIAGSSATPYVRIVATGWLC
jgi:hypothetical protein